LLGFLRKLNQKSEAFNLKGTLEFNVDLSFSRTTWCILYIWVTNTWMDSWAVVGFVDVYGIESDQR
jgi:hypothetical protein